MALVGTCPRVVTRSPALACGLYELSRQFYRQLRNLRNIKSLVGLSFRQRIFDPLPRYIERLRQHPGLANHGQEVRVGNPAR